MPVEPAPINATVLSVQLKLGSKLAVCMSLPLKLRRPLISGHFHLFKIPVPRMNMSAVSVKVYICQYMHGLIS